MRRRRRRKTRTTQTTRTETSARRTSARRAAPPPPRRRSTRARLPQALPRPLPRSRPRPSTRAWSSRCGQCTADTHPRTHASLSLRSCPHAPWLESACLSRSPPDTAPVPAQPAGRLPAQGCGRLFGVLPAARGPQPPRRRLEGARALTVDRLLAQCSLHSGSQRQRLPNPSPPTFSSALSRSRKPGCRST